MATCQSANQLKTPANVSWAFKMVLESGGRGEKLITQVVWSPVLSFHSLWWFGVQCHLLVLVHLVFWKPTSLHPFNKKFWSTSCFLLVTSFLKMQISFSSRICPHCKKHQKLVKWPWCWCAWLASKLTRPEPHRESELNYWNKWTFPWHSNLLRCTCIYLYINESKDIS